MLSIPTSSPYTPQTVSLEEQQATQALQELDALIEKIGEEEEMEMKLPEGNPHNN